MVGEIAGEHDRLRSLAGCHELVGEPAQAALAVDRVVALPVRTDEVGVTEVEEEVVGTRMLGDPQVRHGLPVLQSALLRGPTVALRGGLSHAKAPSLSLDQRYGDGSHSQGT